MRNTLMPAVIAAGLVLAGCAGLPRHVQKTPSVAFQHPETTTLGRIVAADEVGKNLSGFRLLSSGEAALASLIALADHAERTLSTTSSTRMSRPGPFYITCASPRTAACGCAYSSTI